MRVFPTAYTLLLSQNIHTLSLTAYQAPSKFALDVGVGVAAGGARAVLPAVVGGRQPAPPAGVPLVPLLDHPQQPHQDGGGAYRGRLMFVDLPV